MKMRLDNELLNLRRTNLLGLRTSLALDKYGAARSVSGEDVDTEVTTTANSLNIGHPEHP